MLSGLVVEGNGEIMTEDTTTSASVDRFTMLATKMERESRFTRSLLVICTVANLGVMFYGITEIYKSLPLVIIANYMANLDKIVYQTKAIEMTMPHKGAAPAPAATTTGTGTGK